MQKFLFTINYKKEVQSEDVNKDPKIISIKDKYITEAVNYTDAEVSANKLAETYDLKDFSITPITKSNIEDIITNSCDESIFYDVTISEDFEDNGKIKTIKTNLLVEGDSILDVVKTVEEKYDDSKIIKISESVILEFIN